VGAGDRPLLLVFMTGMFNVLPKVDPRREKLCEVPQQLLADRGMP